MGVDRDSKVGSRQAGEVLFDRYRTEDKIADGGMSAVYRCLDLQTRNRVALKILHEVYNDKPVIRERFIDEGRIQQMLTHPNIVDVYDVAESESMLGIVMELVQGPTLEEHLEARGPLSTETILEFMLPVLSAIGFAHSKGVIHRDIKPSNILLKPSSRGMLPRVMDFGVAKLVRGKDLTATGTTVGTLHYMSPEQIVGSKDIDGRADIYSLGCTLYKLCTGDVPFNASTEFALMMAQVEAPPTPPSDLDANVARPLESVIMRCLAKRPDDRFPSVKDLTLAMLDLRSENSKGDTDTIPLSQDLLEYAMNADEVAVDRTGVIDIRALDEAASGSPTQKDMRRVDLDLADDDAPQPTMEMKFDPSVDLRDDGENQDPTVEARLDDLSTIPLSQLGDDDSDTAVEPRGDDDTRPLRGVDDTDEKPKNTVPMESTKTAEFDSRNPWVAGDPSVDSKEQTKPRVTVDAEADGARHDDTTTESAPPIDSDDGDTGGHVQMFERPDLDEELEAPEKSDRTAERVVQVALLLVLMALIAVGVAIVLDYV